jgi:CheY-like chemotaxis protein
VILVVDDDGEIRDSLSAVLSTAGHDVVACGSATAALERAATEEPELILSDVMMPGQGGFEFRAEYASRHPERRTPFVFLSSLGRPEVVGPPGQRAVSAATLDGRTLLKRVSELPEHADVGTIEGILEVQHAALEREVRDAEEKLLVEGRTPQGWKERFDQLFEQGFVEYRKGHWDAARAVWEEARSLNPSDKALEVNLKVVLGKLGRTEPG